MNIPSKLPGKDVPLSSTRQMLICPHCAKKIDVVFIGKDGKAIQVNCPLCRKKIELDFINKFIAIAILKEKTSKDNKKNKEKK